MMGRLTWADVANDLLFLLANKVVGVTTFIRFSAVCKSWNSVASATKCHKLVPWLMLIEKEGSHLRDFYDHSTKEVYQFPLPQARGVKHLGFAHGWLITCDEEASFHLLDPLTGTRIALPPPTKLLSFLRRYTPRFLRDNLTIKAICSPIGPDRDGTVVLTYKDAGFLFSFFQPTDKDWTTLKPFGPSEVACVGGVFYTVTNWGKVFSLDLTSSPKLIKIADLPIEIFLNYYNYSFHESYIVECANEILVVVKSFDIKDLTRVEFRVFKLDVERKKIFDVKSIGEYALFLGTNHSFCLPTSLYGTVFKRNCIYYSSFVAGLRREAGENLSVFDLEDGRLTTFHSVGASKSLHSFPLWVILDPLTM